MIKHKSHMVSMTVNTTDAASEGGNQVIHCVKQDVCQYRSLNVTPQPFDQIQVRTVRRQPENLQSVAVVGQECFDRFAVVKTSIVAHQTNLATAIGLQQDGKKSNKVPTALGIGHRMDNAATSVIYPAIDDLFGILTRGRDFGLLAFGEPHAIQGRMAMQFGFILKDQCFVGVVFEGLFFKRDSFLRAFWQAASSRLPLRVCLGRRKEKPS